MPAVVVRSKRLAKSAAPTLGKRALARAGWLTGFALVCGAAVALSVAAHNASVRRVSPQFLPAAAATATKPASAAIESEVRYLALAFAAAGADGLAATKPGELVPRYMAGIADAAQRMEWMRDDYTLRSKPVGTEDCNSVNGSAGPYAAEQARSGLQCYLDAQGAPRLAYRLEPIDDADRRWQQVDMRLRMLGNVPVVSLHASKTLLSECVATMAPSQVQADTKAKILASQTLCLPAWKWEGAEADLGAVLREEPTEIVWSLRSGGHHHRLRVRAQQTGPHLDWSIKTDVDSPPAAS